MTRILETVIAETEVRPLPEITPRRLELPGLPGKADVVIGMRRSGKTWFVYQQMAERLAAGVDRERILYLNFEDDRLLPLEVGDLHQVAEAFYRLHPESRGREAYFYFDEIQNVPGWETFVRRLLDSEEVRIVLTGSSARLLSREISTSLRGRGLTAELLPFSFEEALRHAGIEPPRRFPPPAPQRSLLENRFRRFLEVGGFPEVQDVTPELHRRILRDYVDVVLLRDVAERHGVDNLAALRYLERALLARPASRFSIHRLYNDLRSQGVRVAKDTLHDYLGHLEDAFLLFTVTVASPSLRVRQSNPRKCYPVDPALAGTFSFQASQDVGHRLENAIYLELRRRGAEVAYVSTAEGFEVDFLAEYLSGERQLVQVCARLSEPETRSRELRALEAAMDETEIEEAVVVTLNEADELERGNRRIHVVPAWRFLLERDPIAAG